VTTPTTVSVQNTPGPYYTWAGSGFGWTDYRGQKSWNTSYDSNYTVSTTEGWTNVERLGKATTKPVAEQFSTAEAAVRNYGLRPHEAIHVSDSLLRNQVRQIAEAISTLERYGNHPILPFAESFSAAEVGVTRSFVKNPHEPIVVGESLARAQDFHLHDGFSIADQYGNDLSKALAEFFQASDDYLKRFGKGIPESWRTAEAYTHIASSILHVVEHIKAQELQGNSFTLPLAEAFAAVESGFDKDYGLRPHESVKVGESLARSIIHRLSEAVSVLEKYAQATKLPFAENFSTEDFIVKNASLGIDEAIATAELFGRTVEYLRLLSEGFKTKDALAKATTLPQAEAFNLLEEYRRHGNGVVSNLSITTDSLDDDAFRALIQASSPPGYSNFKPFITGTYTYQKALFRAVVQSFTLDRGVLTDMSITVDVPDVNDSGEATITNAASGVTVTFNRKYHKVPEITLQLKGGTDLLAVPRFVGSPTNTGFTVILVDPTTGQNVAGTISWAAHGY
jgi:hypothetical protein